MFDSLCKTNNIQNYEIFSVEPFPDTVKLLIKNLRNTKCTILNYSLSDQVKSEGFFFDSKTKYSGQNSLTNHYYLDSNITVNTISLDYLFNYYNLKQVNLLKLNIEGSEYKALLGSRKSLEKGLIDYILFEYNQTWIKNGSSIKKIF